MDYESLLELVKNRRSIRRFKPDPIPDEYVDKIIEVARWAPSGFNQQPWEFVVVKKQELKDSIMELYNEYYRTHFPRMEPTREPWQGVYRPRPLKVPGDFSDAPVFIILFGDTRTKVGLPMIYRFDYLRCQSIFTSSLASAFLYMHLAATTLGLTSMWVSGVQDPLVHCLLKDLLGIPGELEVYDMMVVGYPASKPRPKLMRAKEKMVHYDYCGKEDFRTDGEVNDFVQRTRTWVTATIRRGAD